MILCNVMMTELVEMFSPRVHVLLIESMRNKDTVHIKYAIGNRDTSGIISSSDYQTIVIMFEYTTRYYKPE